MYETGNAKHAFASEAHGMHGQDGESGDGEAGCVSGSMPLRKFVESVITQLGVVSASSGEFRMEIPVFLPEGGQTLHVPMEEKREHVISFVLKF